MVAREALAQELANALLMLRGGLTEHQFEAALEGWLRALPARTTDAELKKAFDKHISESPFFPAPSEILEHLKYQWQYPELTDEESAELTGYPVEDQVGG